MTRFLSILALLAAVVPATASAQDPAAAAERLGDRIETREVSSPRSVNYGRAVGVVDAPIDRVMAVITNYARYKDIMPHFRRSRVLSRRGNNALVYIQASVARNTMQLWAQMRIYQRRPRGETRIIEARMTEGNMDAFIARWEATPLDDGRTLVSFKLLVDPDVPLPSGILTHENVVSARRAIRAVRNEVRTPRYRLAQNR